MAVSISESQLLAIAEAGATAFAYDVHGRAGFDHVLEEAGYYDAASDTVYAEEIRPEWVAIAMRIARAATDAAGVEVAK